MTSSHTASFKLDVFEGPLDLLLTLIKEHKLNIYDIEITLLLEQYLEYINNAEYEDYEEASDFLEMAARLIYIKTCSLLPHDEEARQLKKELEGRLIEYSMCKSAANNLKRNFAGGEIFVRQPVKLPVNKEYSRLHKKEELYNAYMGLSAKSRKAKPLRASVFEPIVSKKIVSVTSKIIYVLKKLYKSGEFEMSHLYDGMTEKSEQVATFLAVLELTKSGRIYLNDDNSMIFFNKKNSHERKNNHSMENEADETALQEESEIFYQEDENEKNHPAVTASAEIILQPAEEKKVVDNSAQLCKECFVKIPDSICTNEDIPQYRSEEEELLLLKNVFKPNYWNSCYFYWGYSSAGGNCTSNYWKYGDMRIK